MVFVLFTQEIKFAPLYTGAGFIVLLTQEINLHPFTDDNINNS